MLAIIIARNCGWMGSNHPSPPTKIAHSDELGCDELGCDEPESDELNFDSDKASV